MIQLEAGVEVRCPNCGEWHTAVQPNTTGGDYERDMLYVRCGGSLTLLERPTPLAPTGVIRKEGKLLYIGQVGQQSRHEGRMPS